MNVEFLTFNNYYNRIIKKFDTVTEYEAATPNNYYTYDVQFNPNDGVNTELIVGMGGHTFPDNWAPDYMITYNDTSNNVISRWFVIEWVRTRGGQYKATLHRDVIADNYNAVMNAPIYVEKATIQNADDVAIYNKENLELNQIKSDESLLKDDTGTAWLVGYVAKNINFGTEEGQISRTFTISSLDVDDAITTPTLASWEYINYVDNGIDPFEYYKQALSVNVILNMSLYPQAGINNRGTCDLNGNVSVSTYGYADFAASMVDMPLGKTKRTNYIRDNILPQWRSHAETIVSRTMSEANYFAEDLYRKLNNKILFVESGTDSGYYTIHVDKSSAMQDNGFFPYDSTIEQAFNGYISDSKFIYQNYPQDDRANIQRDIAYIRHKITLTPYDVANKTFTWPVQYRKLEDAPYAMFCIPASPTKVYSSGAIRFTTSDENDALNTMCAIAEQLGTYCYDIQKVPYCPYNENNNSIVSPNTKGGIDVTTLTLDKDYTFVRTVEPAGYKQIVFFPKKSNFSFDINKSLTLPRYVLDDHDDTYIEDMKIANQCDFYRMYSPNWAASFEFNLVKTGNINKFNVDCTYKPYNPYIHVNPVWSKLYGRDYDDYRGLIVQGDFSIPRINDQWVNYQINNKNNLNAFNRQVESIELKHDIASKMDIFNALTGTVTGGAAGAATGAKLGGGYGAIAGAVIGTGASAVGGALDVKYNEMLRNDALDLTKDQFNYNIQNIQALPETLAKVSTYDKNNKIFPVLEYYTSTYQEKVALLNKMIYNGMTIMRIGTLAEFMDTNRHYIKGKIIRCEEIADDFHVLTAIADELNKGVYI